MKNSDGSIPQVEVPRNETFLSDFEQENSRVPSIRLIKCIIVYW